MMDQMRRDLRDSQKSRIKHEPARGKRKSPIKKTSTTTFKKDFFSSDEEDEVMPQKTSRSQRQASLLNYMK